MDLFADRTSTHWMASNQLRLWFSAFAHLIMSTLQAGVLKGNWETLQSKLRTGEYLHTLHQAGAYFVIRAKKDLHFLRYVSQPIDPNTGLCSDHIGRLGGFYSRKDFPDKLRLVRFYDSVQDYPGLCPADVVV